MEGGQRVPFVISWPNHIIPQESEALVTNMDLMPTLLNWAGARSPAKTIDGIAMNDFFEGKEEGSGREFFSYYSGEELQAIRYKNWKLHRPHTYQKIGTDVGIDGKNGTYEQGEIGWALFDLKNDPGEKRDLSSQYPALLDSLKSRMLAADSLLRLGIRKPYSYDGKMPEVGKLW